MTGRTRRFIVAGTIALPVTALVVVAMGMREARRATLGRELIQATIANDSARAVGLVERGADPNAVNDSRVGRIGLSEGLTRVWHRINNRELAQRGALAIDLAMQRRLDTVVAALIDQGADPNRLDANGRSPLYRAAEMGNLKYVRDLLDRGADVRGHDRSGFTASDVAAFNLHPEVVELLRRNGAEFTQMDAALVHDPGATASGLNFGRDIRTKRVAETLGAACASGDADVVRALLQHGVSPNVRDRHGFTPLMWASGGGFSEIVTLLLQHGASATMRDYDGRTAVNWSAIGAGVDRAAICKQLLAHGPSEDASAPVGGT